MAKSLKTQVALLKEEKRKLAIMLKCYRNKLDPRPLPNRMMPYAKSVND
jgi:hypothetical protein